MHRVGRVGRAEVMGLAVSLVATRHKEKVWYYDKRKWPNPSQLSTKLASNGGCCIWYDEPGLFAAVQKRLSTTIETLDQFLERTPGGVAALNATLGQVITLPAPTSIPTASGLLPPDPSPLPGPPLPLPFSRPTARPNPPPRSHPLCPGVLSRTLTSSHARGCSHGSCDHAARLARATKRVCRRDRTGKGRRAQCGHVRALECPRTARLGAGDPGEASTALLPPRPPLPSQRRRVATDRQRRGLVAARPHNQATDQGGGRR